MQTVQAKKRRTTVCIKTSGLKKIIIKIKPATPFTGYGPVQTVRRKSLLDINGLFIQLSYRWEGCGYVFINAFVSIMSFLGMR